jgi:hypothetical protein
MVDGKRILQIFAISITVIWMFMVFHKGYNDISIIIKENPDNWGQAIGQYLFKNWAGGQQDGSLSIR